MTNRYARLNSSGNIGRSNSPAFIDYPARLDYKQTAEILGFKEHDIQVLVFKGLLEPLGKPNQNARKYFPKVEILALSEDVNWLNKASNATYEHWKEKNANRKIGETDAETTLAE